MKCLSGLVWKGFNLSDIMCFHLEYTLVTNSGAMGRLGMRPAQYWSVIETLEDSSNYYRGISMAAKHQL